MAKFSFNYKNTKINLDVKECRTLFSQTMGLMFRKKSKPLLFVFAKPKRIAIHSFFCKPFIAIWFIEDKIIDIKFVKPWKLHVKPNWEFDKLLEIPSDNDEFYEFFRRKKSHDDRKV